MRYTGKICLAFFIALIYSSIARCQVTNFDGNVYDTVVIGQQTWLKSDLLVTHFRNGDSIPNVVEAKDWIRLKTCAYCDYSDVTANSKFTNRLYNWYCVIDTAGLCPVGFHVPDGVEWKKLINFLGGNFEAGGRLKSTKNWEPPNEAASDSVGFSALPGGHRFTDGAFLTKGYNGNWWTSTKHSLIHAYSISLNTYTGFIDNSNFDNKAGLSVRCIKDKVAATNPLPEPIKTLDLPKDSLKSGQ